MKRPYCLVTLKTCHGFAKRSGVEESYNAFLSPLRSFDFGFACAQDDSYRFSCYGALRGGNRAVRDIGPV